METEIVLMQDVQGLGAQGDIMKVSHGYARNFLFPRKLAAPATPRHIKALEIEKKKRDAEQRRAVEKLRLDAEALSKASCTIAVQAGEDGKLFGSVTSAHIAEALEKGGFTVDKKQIELAEPLKELGVFSVPIRLHQEVAATVKVWIVEK
jgi:large subunit ribosomal protein L9